MSSIRHSPAMGIGGASTIFVRLHVMGIRTRLYIFALLVVALMSLVSGIYLLLQVRDGYESYARRELLSKARVTREALNGVFQESGFVNEQALDDLVDTLGAASGDRVSVIGPRGRLVADSELDGQALHDAEDHSFRPEVVQARQYGEGSARRFSTTISSELFYVAVQGGPEGAVIRLATPTREVDRALTRLRLVLLAAAGLGLLLASAVGSLASHFAAKTMRSLVERARAIGQRGGGLSLAGEDEIGILAGSLNHLADELERTVGRLGEERDRLETILRGTSEGVMALDGDQRIRLINAAAGHLLQLPPNVEGRPIYEVTREPDLLTLAERGVEVSSTLEITMLGGERIVVGRADPLQATGGTVLVLHDVSEMRRLEKIRREFVANVSHELRTPVSIIRANCETLIEGGAIDNEKARGNFLRAIGRNAERLERLVSDLLDLARIEAGKQTIAPREISPRAVAERVASLLQRRADERSIEIVNEIDAALRIYADEKALDQILANLIDNAVKYSDRPGKVWIRAEVVDSMEPGGESPSGTFAAWTVGAPSELDETEPETRFIRLSVEDEGPGIPKQSRSRIFERFYRVDAGRSRDVGGTGLGLSIVKHLAQMLDGYAAMEARQPRGTCFYICFPLKSAPREMKSNPLA